jgi:hypothetical protein
MKRIVGLFLALVLVSSAGAKPLTAFQALPIAEGVVNPAAKKKLIQVWGDRSPQELTPEVWSYVFYDTTADQDGRKVTITGKTVSEIRDGYFEVNRFRLAAYKADEVMDPKRLKIDSDKALDVVRKSTQLKEVKLSTVKFELRQEEDRMSPVWTLILIADKEGYEKEIGTAKVCAESGTILDFKADLKKLQKN